MIGDNMIQKILRYITFEMITSGNPNISGMIDWLDIEKKDVKAVYDSIKENLESTIEMHENTIVHHVGPVVVDRMYTITKNHIAEIEKKLKHLDDILLVSIEEE